MATQTEPLRGTALLQATLDHITAHPEGWDQKTWRRISKDSDDVAKAGPTVCGTAMCFAGEAVQLAEGDRWLARKTELDAIQKIKRTDPGKAWRLTQEAHRLAEWVLVDDTLPEHQLYLDIEFAELRGLPEMVYATTASARARVLLGLDGSQTSTLFHEDNDLFELTEFVELLVADPDADIERSDEDDD